MSAFQIACWIVVIIVALRVAWMVFWLLVALGMKYYFVQRERQIHRRIRMKK